MSAITFGLSICFLGNILVSLASPSDLATSISQFSNSFYGNVITGQTSNIIVSPLSAQTVLTLAFEGANGATANQMKKGLKLKGTKAQIAKRMHNLIEPFQNNPDLTIANAIYVMNSYSIKHRFGVTATKDFYATVQSVDFANNTGAAAIINNWVANETNNLIRNLISPASLGPDTRMVLVNALHFKSSWLHPFKTTATTNATFYTTATDSIQVQMMNLQTSFSYANIPSLDASIVELPYKDSNASMLIILPNTNTGLANVETNLKTVDLNQLTKNMTTTLVDVTIPRFQIQFEISLNNVLRAMGMPTMFSDKADFSGLIAGKQTIKISDVVQKAVITVNENGTEAAAATVVTLTTLAISRPITPPIIFNADHPFMFILKTNDVILFMGKFIQ